MPTRLLLIAHAPTAATRRAAFPRDEAIEPIEAAPLLGPATRCFAAPERRTRETAEALGLDARRETLLADIDLGRWEGRTFEEVLDDDPSGMAAWTTDPRCTPHGGESVEDLITRVGTWLDGEREDGGRIIAVTHPAVIRAAVVAAIGAPATSFWRIDIAPLARIDLRSDNRRWVLREIAMAE